MTLDVDVLVLGLGAMGSAALYHLARDGAEPIGLEQFHVDHPFGSSHGRSRAFRIGYQDPVYVDLVRAALPLWRDLEARSGERLLTLCGMIVFARSGHAGLEGIVGTLAKMGVTSEHLDVASASRRFPLIRLGDDRVGYWTPEAGFLDAGRSVRALIAEARRAGARVIEGARVERLDLEGDPPAVVTATERYRCRRLVVTPGPWAPALLKELELPLVVTRQQKFYFRPMDPAAYGPDRLPVYADLDTRFYGFPHHGPGLKVADDTLGPVTTPDTVDRQPDLRQRDRLQAWLAQLLPGVAAEYVEGATCMYSMTPDGDFLIGPWPRNPAILVGAGFSGHGFKFAILVGRILADLAANGRSRHPVERFRLDRFTSQSPTGEAPRH